MCSMSVLVRISDTYATVGIFTTSREGKMHFALGTDTDANVSIF